MFIWIGRLRNDTEAIQKLSLFSPLVFVPIQAAGVLLYATVQWVREPSFEWISILQGIPVFAGYCLVVGYAYVVVANIIFGICSITGLVREGT